MQQHVTRGTTTQDSEPARLFRELPIYGVAFFLKRLIRCWPCKVRGLRRLSVRVKAEYVQSDPDFRDPCRNLVDG